MSMARRRRRLGGVLPFLGSCLALLAVVVLSSTHQRVAAFSAATSSTPAARLALLRDLRSAAAAATADPSQPLSQRIRTAVLEGGHQPLTRCELELVLPRDRTALRAAEEQATAASAAAGAARSTDKESKAHLSLGLSLRAYESAVAENHKDVGATLERWRRVVALRQNRVLVPGRAAELYSQLVSTLLWADEFDLARQVLQYVGLTPEAVYLPSASASIAAAAADGEPLVCDLGPFCYKIAKQMLDIPLEKWEWEAEGQRRGQAEPPSPREQGEAIAEWLWKQVPPAGGDAELVHYVNDMALSVLRLALREAKARGHGALTLRLQPVEDPGAPLWGMSRRGLVLPRASLELLRETDAPAVGVELELQEP